MEQYYVDQHSDPQAGTVSAQAPDLVAENYRQISIGIVVKAIRDARKGDLNALLWLQGPEAADLLETIGMDAGAGKEFAQREGPAIVVKSLKRGSQKTTIYKGAHWPRLYLDLISGAPDRLLAAGIVWPDDEPTTIKVADLPAYQRKFELIPVWPGARPTKSSKDHLATRIDNLAQARNYQKEE